MSRVAVNASWGLLVLVLRTSTAGAEAPLEPVPPAEDDVEPEGASAEEEPPPAEEEAPSYESVVVGQAPVPWEESARATSVVTPRHMQERLPRSSPDALRYEPGAFVQQTAHAQASTFVRGLTGQQTVLLFDGIRLNNATFRQGPNQYFFTVDSRTVSSLEVTRGSSSVLYGSDALGGVIAATPRDPRFFASVDRFRLTPRTMLRLTTTDAERGGRFEAEAQVAQRAALLVGAGYRTVGLLEGGGAVLNPADGELPQVPRLADDGRTQLGTGFDELTFDGRLVVDLGSAGRATAAVYGYRQHDAPRTDQCPAAFAPHDECLTYEEQFRTLAYLAFDGSLGAAAETLRVSASYQGQHERRRLDRPSSFVLIRGLDDVHTAGLVARAATARWQPLRVLGLRLRYGTDLYADWLSSSASTEFTDVAVTVPSSRGMYLDGSRYVWWGAYAEVEATFPYRLKARAGARLSVSAAQAPGDEASGSSAVDQEWVAPVGRGGLEWWPTRWLGLLVNVDQGFRAPNLDDLTSRQQTGPGFQFENADLRPERSLTVETGLRVESRWVRAALWGFWTGLDDSILRSPRTAEQCPPDTPACRASWNRFQLVNADERSDVFGVEAMALLRIPYGFFLRATIAWAWGEGPNPGDPPSDPSIAWDERVPLSRIPPLNGTVELRWRSSRTGLFAGAGLRWAVLQDRLALSDESDERIPLGGTPGFAVVDLRAGWRLDRFIRRRAVLALVVENVTDAAYRYHGSSVNGPGRGLMVELDLGL